jgi:hypothetical protein
MPAVPLQNDFGPRLQGHISYQGICWISHLVPARRSWSAVAIREAGREGFWEIVWRKAVRELATM